MSIWDNVKKFTQPYNDDEYDEYDEDDEYMDDYEEVEEKPRRSARSNRGARRTNPFREPERERESAPAPAQEYDDDYEDAFNSIPKAAAAAPAPAAAAPAASGGFNGRVVSMNKNDVKHNIVLFRPNVFNDANAAGDDLKNNRVVIMNLENVDTKVARRVVDFLSGCIYAMDGSVKKIAQSAYIFCPSSVEVSGDLESLVSEVEQYV